MEAREIASHRRFGEDTERTNFGTVVNHPGSGGGEGNKIIRMFEIDQARVSYFTIICGSSRVTRVTVLFAKSLIYLNKTKCRWNL